MDVFAQAAAHAFTAAGAATETYRSTAVGAATSVSVIFERGVSLLVPGREARVVDRTLRAHFLVSEVGRPPRGATVTDGDETRTIDAIEADDGIVVVCKVK